jgi:DNA polymerase-3 subunit delta'
VSVYSDLVGQAHIVEVLQKAVHSTRTGEETQEMTHAWVFTGPPGSGRSSAAVAFAQALVCAHDGCGRCNECRSAANGAHPDVEIIRTESMKFENY